MSGASGGPAPKPSWDPWGLRAAIGALYRTAAKVTGIGVEGGSSRWLNRLSPASEDMAENRLRFI